MGKLLSYIDLSAGSGDWDTPPTPPGPTFLYDYGWPTGGTFEPNVFAQWTFQELSSPIVDSVAALTVPNAYNPAGVHYNVASGINDWPGNGIRLEGNALFGLTSDIGLSISGDFVFEWVSLSIDSFSEIVWSLNSAKCAVILRGLGAQIAQVYLGDGTNNVMIEFPLPAGIFTGYHKFRLAGTVGGSVQLFIDGSACGTPGNLSALIGPITGADGIGIGWWNGVAASTDTTYRELRITNGNKTNNSGGPGGG